MECQCSACVRDRLNKQIQKQVDNVIARIDRIDRFNSLLKVLPPTDDELTKALKGQLFTYTGRIDRIRDNSYVGNVYEIQCIAGDNVVAVLKCSGNGGTYDAGKSRTFNRKMHGIIMVEKSYLISLRGW